MDVLLTGHTGFLGGNIRKYIDPSLNVQTLGRANADILCDLGACAPNLKNANKYTSVIHAAGQAHVIPKSREERELFYLVNYRGTQNLCNGLASSDRIPRSFIFFSSVAVYGKDSGLGIEETSPLHGNTPYAESKIQAEIWLKNWCDKFNVCLTILRLPLIAGSNPPGNLGAMIKGIKTGRYVRIGKGDARKSIVLASDVAAIIPKAAEVGGIYNLTDGYHPTFAELEELIASQLGKTRPRSIPYSAAKVLGWAGDVLGSIFPVNTDTVKKITSNLTFDDSRARKKLGWSPRKVLDHFKID